MPVSFQNIRAGESYSRKKLAQLWGYSGHQALSRGVVTPSGDNKIVLFVTREKRSSDEQYEDELREQILHWEGPGDHFAEDRMLQAAQSGDEIHLFYRDLHDSDFTYYGQLDVIGCQRYSDRSSTFTLRIRWDNGATNRPTT